MFFEFDPYSPENIQDPYPSYRRLRDEMPVYHNERMKFWALTRFDDVCAALRDSVTFSSTGGVTIEGTEAGVPALVLKNPPDHTWHRTLVTLPFSPQRMATLETFIRARAAALLEQAAARDEFDVFTEFTLRLPLDVISELIGIPPELRDEVHHLSTTALLRGTDGAAERAAQAEIDKNKLFRALVVERRAQPRDDVITLLINAEVTDEAGKVRKFDNDELALSFGELASAGHETVAKAISSGLIALHRFPDERQQLQNDFGLMRGAVEEMLRFDPPPNIEGRTTTRDVKLHGTTIPKSSKVMLAIGSACHDERAFADSDRLDVDRNPDIRSLHFGFGIHKCLGMHLARIEMRIAFEELFRRFPNYEVDPSRAHRSAMANVRGVDYLPFRPGKHA